MSQENVELGQHALEELAGIWDAPLALMRREAYPQDRWLLE